MYEERTDKKNLFCFYFDSDSDQIESDFIETLYLAAIRKKKSCTFLLLLSAQNSDKSFDFSDSIPVIVLWCTVSKIFIFNSKYLPSLVT